MALLRQLVRGINNLSIGTRLTLPKNANRNILPQLRLQSTSTTQEVIDPDLENKIAKDVIANVNEQLQSKREGRLFAIIHVAGKQRRVTEGDVIIVEGHWAPDVGDTLNFDKVLMVGATDFTVIGRPILQKGLVDVHATVIEKGLSHTKTHFKKKRRKQYMRIHFMRVPHTMLRINKVAINGDIDKPPEVTGLEYRIF